MSCIVLMAEKVRAAYRQQRIRAAIAAGLRRYGRRAGMVRYLIHNPAARFVTLHCPDYVQPDANDAPLVERIFQAFRMMKRQQSHEPPHYLPSGMWNDLLGDAYSEMTESIRTDDVSRFHFFLANFGAWKKYTGIESSTLIRESMRSYFKRSDVINAIFYSHYKFWSRFYHDRKPLSALAYPRHGNQAGAFLNGVFVGIGSFFNEIYGSLLAGLLHDRRRPVIAELGSGYGKLAYFTLRHRESFCFLDFDLPEILCLAAYYLMKAYPDRPALLYGEEDYSPELHGKYDLIFMPCWEIEKLGKDTVDLFINKNSLGEMDRDAVRNYVGHIADATRYFFHLNHDRLPTYHGKEPGLLAFEYPVPSDRFTLLFRYPDFGHLLYRDGCARLNDMDTFIYLYVRNKCIPESSLTSEQDGFQSSQTRRSR